MVSTKDVTLATMATQHKNARMYEYLYGALLESEAKTQTEKDMVAYRQRAISYLDGLDDETGTGLQTSPSERLLAEIKLNVHLLQTVRKCQSALWEKHGYGLPVVRCASKWVFQDYPSMLARSLTPRQPLTFLCKHVLDKYNCISDHIVADVCSRLDKEPLVSSVLQRLDEHKKKTDDCDFESRGHIVYPSDGSAHSRSDEKASFLGAIGIDMPIERKSVRPEVTLFKGATYTREGGEATLDERLALYKTSLVEALQKLRTTLSQDLDSVSQTASETDPGMSLTDAVEKKTTQPVRYWPPFSNKPSVSTNSCSRDALLKHASDLTPLDPEFGVSPCSVRSSRKTPLRAPVKKGNTQIIGPNYEESLDESPDVELGPYTKPLFRKRISHVTRALNTGDETEAHWKAFHTCLEAVRQRVIQNLTPKILTSSSDHKTDTEKRKKHKKKTRRKRKCKKHAQVAESILDTVCVNQETNNDVTSAKHVTTGEVTSKENEISSNNRKSVEHQSLRKEKKLKRRKKRRKKNIVEVHTIQN